jgi:hypothetical protein
MSASNRHSSFSESAFTLATFGIVTVLVTVWEKRRRQDKEQERTQNNKAAAKDIPHQYPFHPPEKIVQYLHQHSGKKWNHYSQDQECFVRECPKVELHVHLDGSLDPDFLWHCLQAYEEREEKSWIACLPVSTTLPWDAQRPLPVR